MRWNLLQKTYKVYKVPTPPDFYKPGTIKIITFFKPRKNTPKIIPE